MIDPWELHHFMELIREELGDAFVVDKERNVIWSRVGFGNYEPNIGIRFNRLADFVVINGVYPNGLSGKSISISIDRKPGPASRDIMRRLWPNYRSIMEAYYLKQDHPVEDLEMAYRLLEYGFEIDTSKEHPVAKGGKYGWTITIVNGTAHIVGSIPMEDLIVML